MGVLSLLQGIFPTQGLKPTSPALQEDSLPAEKQGKPGVGSLSLLQQIFLTQELNQGLLHYRQILYQLSHEGSPPMNFVEMLIVRHFDVRVKMLCVIKDVDYSCWVLGGGTNKREKCKLGLQL